MLSKIHDYFNSFTQQSDTSYSLELATAILLIEISLADSEIQAEELKLIEQLICNSFNLEREAVVNLIETAKTEVDQATSLYEFTHLLKQKLSYEERIAVIEKLWQVAFADQKLDKYEEYSIRKIADLLYVSHTDYIKAKHRAKTMTKS